MTPRAAASIPAWEFEGWSRLYHREIGPRRLEAMFAAYLAAKSSTKERTVTAEEIAPWLFDEEDADPAVDNVDLLMQRMRDGH